MESTKHVPTFAAGDVVLVRNPHDARLGRGGKVYRLECDGPALFALRDEGGTIRYRYLRAEVARLAAGGRIVQARDGGAS